MKLIVGLGNPGRKYEATRHNAGFWFVDDLARLVGASFRREAAFNGEVARVPRSEIWLLKPETFMNDSGRAIGALARFYRIGTDVILKHDGLVDKLVGDEVIGLFFGGVSGPRHARAAVAAAADLMSGVARRDASPIGAIPIGAGVHTGEAYVGTTGPEGAVDDFTALGDVVNTTARLAGEAVAGELVVSAEAARAAGVEAAAGGTRSIKIRGRSEPVTVLSFSMGDPGA